MNGYHAIGISCVAIGFDIYLALATGFDVPPIAFPVTLAIIGMIVVTRLR